MATKYGILALSEQRINEVENWLGAQIDVTTTTGNPGPDGPPLWGLSHFTWFGDDKKAEFERVFGQSDRRLVGHFKMAGGDERGSESYPYEEAANGDHDAGYRQTAQELVDVGMEDTIIRVSAEFNLSWGQYPGDPQNYADGFARVVREMQSVDGADFTFLYSPGGNQIGVAEEAWPLDSQYWPSGEPTPFVAPSFYDASFHYDGDTITQEDREKGWIDTRDNKLKMWEEMAQRLGASGMAAPEWGVATEQYPPPTGEDNPYFMEHVLDYMDSNYEFVTYWNSESASGGSHEIYPSDAAGLNEASQVFQDFVGQKLSGSTDESTSEPETTYGGYSQPEEGTANWHVPLNENFADIEADIKELAARIEQLEN